MLELTKETVLKASSCITVSKEKEQAYRDAKQLEAQDLDGWKYRVVEEYGNDMGKIAIFNENGEFVDFCGV